MAKQSFSVGQVLTAAQVNALQTNDYNQTVSTKTISYVLVAEDKGTRIVMNSTSATTITVNTGLFDAGDTLYIHNTNSGVSTITAGTATVSTSASLVLAQNQGGLLYFTSASASIFFQFATPASGDIEGVTAGTGISGGGTSGTVTITNSMATEIDAKGDLVAGTGADTFARLAVGTNNQVLTADSTAATGLKWATPAGGGGGKVLQVVSTTYSTRVDIASTTYTDSGLSLSITPTSATSKILVLVSQGVISYRNANGLGTGVRLVRGSSGIYMDVNQTSIPPFSYGFSTIVSGEVGFMFNYSYLDSPATTSSTTYKTQGAVSTTANSQDMAFQKGSQASMILLEIGA